MIIVKDFIEEACKQMVKEIVKEDDVLAAKNRVQDFMYDFGFSQDDSCVDIETVVDALESYEDVCNKRIEQNIKQFFNNK